jgi:Transposase C of IS166 homeodomain
MYGEGVERIWQAAHTRQIIALAWCTDVCSICGDSRDYQAIGDTYRQTRWPRCDCVMIATVYGRAGIRSGSSTACAELSLAVPGRVLSLEEAAEFAPEQVVGLSQELAAAQQQVDVFKHQLEWYKRQLFGHKSERRIIESGRAQLKLGELIDPGQGQAAQPKRGVSAHTRSVATKRPEAGDECVSFFDETRVPVELIELPATQAAGLRRAYGSLVHGLGAHIVPQAAGRRSGGRKR